MPCRYCQSPERNGICYTIFIECFCIGCIGITTYCNFCKNELQFGIVQDITSERFVFECSQVSRLTVLLVTGCISTGYANIGTRDSACPFCSAWIFPGVKGIDEK